MKLKRLFAAATLVLASSMVFAGLIVDSDVEVTINSDLSGTAIGSMSSARFSNNHIESIGCGVRTFGDSAGGSFSFGFCRAVMDDGSAEGLAGVCFTDSGDLLETMRAVADYSFITFSWDAEGECTRVGYSTQSFYIPKSKAKIKGN